MNGNASLFGEPRSDPNASTTLRRAAVRFTPAARNRSPVSPSPSSSESSPEADARCQLVDDRAFVPPSSPVKRHAEPRRSSSRARAQPYDTTRRLCCDRHSPVPVSCPRPSSGGNTPRCGQESRPIGLCGRGNTRGLTKSRPVDRAALGGESPHNRSTSAEEPRRPLAWGRRCRRDSESSADDVPGHVERGRVLAEDEVGVGGEDDAVQFEGERVGVLVGGELVLFDCGDDELADRVP